MVSKNIDRKLRNVQLMILLHEEGKNKNTISQQNTKKHTELS